MTAVDAVDLGQGHVVELGRASWDEEAVSILNRYFEAAGRTDPVRSCEIPVRDLIPMLGIALKHRALPLQDCVQAFQALLDFIVADDGMGYSPFAAALTPGPSPGTAGGSNGSG